MRVGDVREASFGPATVVGGEAEPARPESRALVALTPPVRAAAAPTNYRAAPFLAHLLAVKDQHAQTRDRRRAAPHEAIAAYKATKALMR
jgi:acetyl esterase/lipase